MTTQTAEKTKQEKSDTQSRSDIRAAYECHTLALLLYDRIAATHPWVVAAPCAPPVPGVYAAGPYLQPMTGPAATPWAPAWFDTTMHSVQGGMDPTRR